MKLSFILPCYNVSRYIEECLDSLYNQELSEDDFEVICVNDCSTDDTRNKIVAFAQQHSNLRLIDHKTNQTAGGARNTGIENARGEYVWFVDPDDVVKPACSNKLYNVAKQNKADILMFNFDGTDESLNVTGESLLFSESEVLTGQDFVVDRFSKRLTELCIVWRCLFERGFIKKYDLKYPIMRKSQDVVFLWKSLFYAERVCSVPWICYSNRGNPYSVAKMKNDAEVLFSERVLFAHEIYKILNIHNVEIKPMIQEDMIKTLKWCVNSNVVALSRLSLKERKKYYSKIVSSRDMIEELKPFMNKKNKFLFSAKEKCGEKMWLIKVKLLSVLCK